MLLVANEVANSGLAIKVQEEENATKLIMQLHVEKSRMVYHDGMWRGIIKLSEITPDILRVELLHVKM